MLKIKKLLSVAMCGALSLSIFTGCSRTITTSQLISDGTAATTSVISGKEITTDTSSGKDTDKGTSKPQSTHNSSKGNLVVAGAGTDPNADYSVSGTVTVAVDTARATDYEALFDTLKAVYKNLNIKFDYFAHTSEDSAAEYLSTRAAAGKLPDIVWDEAGKLPLYLTQGWIYPLDSFVNGDPDFKYIPNNLIRDYTFCGKLYALPHQAHYEATFMNLDVLEAINKPEPSLSWTPEDFSEYLKAATTDKYSGIEKLFMIPTLLTNAFDKNTTLYGYNQETHQYNVDGFIEAIKYTIGLRAIPGLEAWALRRTSSGGKTDYAIKFGSNSDNTAFNKGLTLFHGVGTWELADAESRWSNMNWTMWTVPQSKSNPGCMPLHVDHCFMTSTCKNPKSAFQVLRYITYSKEGNIARLSMYDSENKGKYATINNLYYPTTMHPEVIAKFKTLPKVSKCEMYLFENIGKSIRYDMAKITPSWNEILSNYIAKPVNEATDGTASNASQILTEMQSKANAAMNTAWSEFEKKLKSKQSEFSSSHPGL